MQTPSKCSPVNMEGRERAEDLPVTLRYYHTIPSQAFFLNRANYRRVIADFFYEYCNPFYNLNSSSIRRLLCLTIALLTGYIHMQIQPNFVCVLQCIVIHIMSSIVLPKFYSYLIHVAR